MIKLFENGQFSSILEQASSLLLKFPKSSTLFNIIGAAHAGVGNAEEAIQAYKNAISIKPTFAEAWYNMGVTLHEQRQLSGALEAYNRAATIKPNYAQAHNNMGVILKDFGDFTEAKHAYDAALSINPDHAEALTNLGNLFKDTGQIADALNIYVKVLNLKPDFVPAHAGMGDALHDVKFEEPNSDLQKHILAILEQRSLVRPTDIVRAALSLLKLEPRINKQLQLISTDRPKINLLETISELSMFPLLLKFMSICPLADLEFEGLLKYLRFEILTHLNSLDPTPELLSFQSALAMQCFTNEYIYEDKPSEVSAVQLLEQRIEKSLINKEQPCPQSVLALASYRALNTFKWCKALNVNDDIREVFIRQVEEPDYESQTKSKIPVLEEISNLVSTKVREQYEESPYPRWVNLALHLNPSPILNVADTLQLRLNNEHLPPVEQPQILVAGCGTGQHSIGTATRFKNAQVLAVDLSLSSLSYAKRKTEELNITNIKYLQADILALEKLNKQFDVIESVGVLHHMEDPMAGWRVLTNCLKPGGLMKIGLYSDLARQHVAKIRREINDQKISSNNLKMKSFRSSLINSNKEHHRIIANSNDFYTSSTLRDLLFHVQEHRFTIPQIKLCLDTLNLTFCGFEAPRIVSDFKRTYTQISDPYDLEKWEAYENNHPAAFGNMYQFWCQKVMN